MEKLMGRLIPDGKWHDWRNEVGIQKEPFTLICELNLFHGFWQARKGLCGCSQIEIVYCKEPDKSFYCVK